MKKFLLLITVSIFLLIVATAWSNSLSKKDPDVLSTNGIHFHPQLEIYIKGEKQEIPKNIGLAGIHNPIHTHEDLPIIHLEFSGKVRKDDVKLGKFFQVWNKDFSSEKILGYENGPEGTVSMLVNGELNNEFEKYEMHDGDKIEIRYE